MPALANKREHPLDDTFVLCNVVLAIMGLAMILTILLALARQLCAAGPRSFAICCTCFVLVQHIVFQGAPFGRSFQAVFFCRSDARIRMAA